MLVPEVDGFSTWMCGCGKGCPTSEIYVRFLKRNQLLPKFGSVLMLSRGNEGNSFFMNVNISSTVANSYGYPPSQSTKSVFQCIPRSPPYCLSALKGFLNLKRWRPTGWVSV